MDRYYRHHRLTLTAVSLIAVVLLLSGYSGWLAPSQYGAFPAMMVLAYPIIASGALLALLYCLIVRRWLCALILFIAMVSTWPSLQANFPINLCAANKVDSLKTFKVMSYNVASFNDSVWLDKKQMHPAMRQILAEDADFVVLIQPVTSGLGYDERESIYPWLSEIEQHYPYRTHSRYDGADLLSKYPFRAVPLSLPSHSYRYFPYVIKSTGRYAFDIEMPDSRQLRIIGAYMTSFLLDDDQRRVLDSANYDLSIPQRLFHKFENAFTHREGQCHKLRDSLDVSPANVILCTDLNDVPQSYAYRTIVGNDLHDAFGECHTGYLNTFNAHRMLFHIDHILYRGAMCAISFKCLRVPYSDHYPIVATFAWQ